MENQQQNPDSSWGKAREIDTQGWAAKLETRLRKRGFNRPADWLARFDERNLGK